VRTNNLATLIREISDIRFSIISSFTVPARRGYHARHGLRMPGPPGMALVLTEEWLTKYAMKEQVRCWGMGLWWRC
jgi:hypothetical protein